MDPFIRFTQPAAAADDADDGDRLMIGGDVIAVEEIVESRVIVAAMGYLL